MKKRLFSTFLALSLVVSLIPTSVWAEELEDVLETPVCTCETRCAEDGVKEDCQVCQSDVTACTGEEIEQEQPQVPDLLDTPEENDGPVIYVSKNGDDSKDGQTVGEAVQTLDKAVEKAPDGATIYVLSDLTIGKLARIVDKDITITSGDGGPYTITRAIGFAQERDNARNWYNPAMIEVTTPTSKGASVTLKNIILDDAGRHEGTYFTQASSDGVSTNNTDCVQDAMIAAYGTDSAMATITLDVGAVLKNFGGMSAVRVTGGTALTMRSGSKICDDTATKHGESEEEDLGPTGAVWVQSGSFTMETGAEISGINGRAVYADQGTVNMGGTISNLTYNENFQNAFQGLAVHLRGGATGEVSGEVHSLDCPDNVNTSSVLHVVDGGTLTVSGYLHDISLLNAVNSGKSCVINGEGLNSKVEISGKIDTVHTATKNHYVLSLRGAAEGIVTSTGKIENIIGNVVYLCDTSGEAGVGDTIPGKFIMQSGSEISEIEGKVIYGEVWRTSANYDTIPSFV